VGVGVRAAAEDAEVDGRTVASGVDARVGAGGDDGPVLCKVNFAAVPGEHRVIPATVLVDGAGVRGDEHWQGAVGEAA